MCVYYTYVCAVVCMHAYIYVCVCVLVINKIKWLLILPKLHSLSNVIYEKITRDKISDHFNLPIINVLCLDIKHYNYKDCSP